MATMAAVVTPTSTQVVQSSPPIIQIIPFISKTSAFLVATSSRLTRVLLAFTSWASYPTFVLVKAPLPAIHYILSPIIVFGQIVIGVFFVIPYNAVVDIFVALQPFYVLCGVACICGAVVGLSGRLIAVVVSALVMGPGKVEGGPSAEASFDDKRKKRVGT